MKRRLTRENAAEAVLLPLAFFLIFVLPVLVGEAPPVLTASGLAGFVAAHMAGLGKRKMTPGRGPSPWSPCPRPICPAWSGFGATRRSFGTPA